MTSASITDEEPCFTPPGARLILPLLTVMLLVVTWEITVVALGIPRVILPPPSEVFGQMVRFAPYLAQSTLITLGETLAGFLLGVAVGIPIAVAITYSRLLQATLYPLIVTAQSIPKVSIAPLVLIWLGYGVPPKILIAFLVSFFPIIIDTATGLNAVEQELLDLTRSLRASGWQTFTLIRLPSALPFVFAGFKVAITLAVIGAVIGEFVGANSGLGYVLLSASANFNMPLAFGCLVILSALGIVLFGLVEQVERWLLPWHYRAEPR
jgi:NitT/TauT family transport system permease protein